MMMVMKEPESSSQQSIKSKRLRQKQDQVIASYLNFGYSTACFLAIFTTIYGIVFFYNVTVMFRYRDHRTIGFQALPSTNRNKKNQQQNDAATKQPLGPLKKIFDKFRHDVPDTHLLQQVENEMALLRKSRQRNQTIAENNPIQLPDVSHDTNKNGAKNDAAKTPTRNGFVVLGMHRSGTSMLSGLMVTGLGYSVGEPLIGSAFDNEKGFFELLDVVLQNDEFMNTQDVWWSYNVINYDYKKALSMAQSNLQQGKHFKHGRKALKFLNDPLNAPWLQKDPRMCITLKTWLPLLSSEPAVVWTYRHPMEVAHSLIKREVKFTLDHALRLWIVYNMRALQNSAGLCRVFTSNEDVIKEPMTEVSRISKELTTKCGVPKPPTELSIDDVNKFVDPSLQHNQNNKFSKGNIIEKHGSDCNVHELVTTTEKTDPIYETELRLYRLAMRFYCDMKSGIAYKDSYEWPEL